MKLNLGVIDMPYGYGDEPDKTTHEVANELEDRYKLFTHFFNAYRDEIFREVHEVLSLQLFNHIQYGAPFDEETLILETVTKRFHVFLELEEMAGLGVKGVPTWAAIRGVNSRLKTEKGPRRPSFIDGGLLKANFLAWIDFNA